MAIKAWQVVLGPIYDYLDGRWLGHALRRPESKRLAMHKANQTASAESSESGAELDTEGAGPSPIRAPRQLKGWQPNRKACVIVGSELGCAIIVAWVVSFDSIRGAVPRFGSRPC